MTFTIDNIGRLLWMGVTAPRDGAKAVLGLGFPREVLVPIASLVSVLLAIFMFVQAAFLPPPEFANADGSAQQIQVSPILFSLVALGFILAYSWALAVAGRRIGGQGTFEGALSLITYLQAILLGFQLIELGLVVVGLAPLGMMVATAAFIFGFWLNIVFVDELHGFGSLGKSFLLLMVVSAAFAFALVLILSMAGVRVAG